MDPDQVFTQFEKAVTDKFPKGYRVEVRNLHGGSGISISTEHEFLRKAVEAMASAYGVKPVFMREGGSIPIAALFDSVLHVPVVLMGFGLPGDGAHGPNEHFSLTQFYQGIRTVAHYFEKLAEQEKKR